jgi:hypothetical protein
MAFSDEPVAEDPIDGDVQLTSSYVDVSPPPRSRSRAETVLAAAMLGLGEILEPE